MHWLRSSSTVVRLVLAWLLLTLGVAFASPWVAPQAMELVCAQGGSVKLVVVDDDGRAQATIHHGLDCPLCLATGLPPSVDLPTLRQPQPLAHALHPIVRARIAALVGAPLPPRGPPAVVLPTA
ncbi:DUF2946 domain-containing protein [uncultured Pseudacidovorax sp.]|uniref:DUF2946 family protein n=1 Tax=uncultured Pseudacidovorax sp. TaxID=679313 RepID=UPI0025FAD039|nr:DUF2946 domain-containing protein [uncultured Pseudacidovorax sp.]